MDPDELFNLLDQGLTEGYETVRLGTLLLGIGQRPGYVTVWPANLTDKKRGL